MRVVIVGAGSLGTRAARILSHRDHEVVVIELEPSCAESVRESLDCGVICGDGTRPAVLSEADPRHSDALLALTSNAQTNLIASLIGRSVGFARVITRIDDEEFEHVALELGLSDTIIPARTIGRHLADVVEGHDVMELSGAIKGDARVFLFVAREDDEGSVEDLGLPSGARVSHCYREEELVLAEPRLRLRKGDEVVVVTHRKHVDELRSRWASQGGPAES
ncbi:MAG: TrkA family potassium uptake protein [Deltaproteobacteria bacterium]|jgi:trk system potassium uptake protein TrkA|nr:TrkA family potassium uptake protein [Deltaproteobacteria bacterium]